MSLCQPRGGGGQWGYGVAWPRMGEAPGRRAIAEINPPDQELQGAVLPVLRVTVSAAPSGCCPMGCARTETSAGAGGANSPPGAEPCWWWRTCARARPKEIWPAD